MKATPSLESDLRQKKLADFNSISKSISDINTTIDSHTKSVREELDEHRVAIDEVAEDIDRALNAVDEVDLRYEGQISALNARIDRMQMMFAQAIMRSMVQVELARDEQMVFAMIQKKPCTAEEIAKKCNLPSAAVLSLSDGMQDKGIPVIKAEMGGIVYISLDASFAEAQRKSRIIHIDPAVEQTIENRMLGAYFA